ncbi:MAG: glycosyltransferase family 39 protein [Verrucomicrobiota bacterium]|nr:glycosyltransferase family 39 protein [Verrucomicrobiota bacterium]
MTKERIPFRLGEGLGWAALLLAAAVVRVRGARNGLMLDEIWSLYLARAAKSPLAVFTTLHNSNNHYLNTLWLYLIGEHGNWPGYRIPSLIAGVAAVAVAGLIGRRRSRSAAFFAMILTAFSYVQVLYSDEARGYAALVFFALLYFYALQLLLARPDWRRAAMVALTAILGLSAQLIFLNAFAAAVVWSSWVLWHSPRPKSAIARDLFICHLPPLLFLGWLYWVDLRWLAPVLGTPTTLTKSFASAITWIVPPLAPGGGAASRFARRLPVSSLDGGCCGGVSDPRCCFM